MNFFNPYYYTIPSSYVQPNVGLLGRLFGRTGVTINNFLNGTQRVLNLANQTIPLVKQVRPMIGNAKTMFKVMNEFKKTEKPVIRQNNISTSSSTEETEIPTIINAESGPTFFI